MKRTIFLWAVGLAPLLLVAPVGAQRAGDVEPVEEPSPAVDKGDDAEPADSNPDDAEPDEAETDDAEAPPAGEEKASESAEGGDEGTESEASESDEGSGDSSTADEPLEPTPEDAAVAEDSVEAAAETAAAEEKARVEAEAKASEEAKTAIERVPYKPWEDIGDTTFDWIRVSGEWLKGDIKEMRDGDLQFDSDEFGLQTVGWDDVQVLHSVRRHFYVFDDKETLAGTADLAEGKLMVRTDEGDITRTATSVMSVVREGNREIQHWRFKLTWGATLRRGNTQTADYTAFARLRREDLLNRFTLQYDGALGLVRDERNTNKHRGTANWILFLSPVFYLVPVATEVLHDEFQNIRVRWIAAAGGGVHVVDTDDVTLDFQLGLGYSRTRFDESEPGEPSSQEGFLTIPELVLHWDVTDDVEFDASWYSALFVPDVENSFHHGTARFSVDITDKVDVDLSAAYDRIEEPAPRDDGTVPLRDDVALTAGIGIDLD